MYVRQHFLQQFYNIFYVYIYAYILLFWHEKLYTFAVRSRELV